MEGSEGEREGHTAHDRHSSMEAAAHPQLRSHPYQVHHTTPPAGRNQQQETVQGYKIHSVNVPPSRPVTTSLCAHLISSHLISSYLISSHLLPLPPSFPSPCPRCTCWSCTRTTCKTCCYPRAPPRGSWTSRRTPRYAGLMGFRV